MECRVFFMGNQQRNPNKLDFLLFDTSSASNGGQDVCGQVTRPTGIQRITRTPCSRTLAKPWTIIALNLSKHAVFLGIQNHPPLDAVGIRN